jgi:tripartite-type tricarboxylate transporter receptor subunit TctC
MRVFLCNKYRDALVISPQQKGDVSMKKFLKPFQLGLAAASLIAAFGASAQSGYPNRPVKIIVPFAASGPADNYARFMAQRLQDALGQPLSLIHI